MNGKTVFLIGIGLIGGSLALTIKKHFRATVIGYDIQKNQAELAQSIGIVDEVVDELEHGVQPADFIIISAPVRETVNILDKLIRLPLKRGAIVTDTGSTKTEICQRGKVLYEKGVHFIGGHPLAGSHKSGPAAATPTLFENAFYVLTPESNVPDTAVDRLKTWLSGANARFITMTPEEHDRIVGTISHFPHIVAASLVHQLKEMERHYPEMEKLAAGGFRDITRIASANPVMWRDILLHNKNEMLDLLKRWQEQMNRVKTMLEKEDESAIFSFFQKAKAYRDALPAREKGALPSFYDLFVDLPDYPGMIAKVTGLLSKDGINLRNIEILEVREDILGVLRLSFRSEKDRLRAQNVLEQENYKTYLIQ